MDGALAATIMQYLPRIGQSQTADNPGRHETGGWVIDLPVLLAPIDRIG